MLVHCVTNSRRPIECVAAAANDVMNVAIVSELNDFVVAADAEYGDCWHCH